MKELKFHLNAKRLVRQLFLALLTVEISFVLLDIVMNYGALIPIGSVQRLFNIAREDSLAAWSASVQTLFTAMVLWLIYAANRKRAWGVIAGFFTYLAVDDGSKFHERIGTAVKQSSAAGREVAEAALDKTYTWQYVFGPFLVCMGIFILIFLWRELKAKDLRILIVAALASYALAVGLDFVEGLPVGYETVAAMTGLTPKFVNHFGRVIEEFLELFGTTLFLVAFLRHFIGIAPKTAVHFHQ